MEINSRIPYIDVVILTKDLCEYVTGEEHKIVRIPVKLKEDGVLKDYLSIVVCKKMKHQ